ncbi:MAG: prolyl-tRNA synthetase associated domain-containing protein [Gammaproteobacteria bacterium]|nr:prolyl-tRNA synthetase associated domain-containing protein [Gammaproteobacteria bacterium]
MAHADRPDPDSVVLLDGSKAATADDICQQLDVDGVSFERFFHEPIFTVDQGRHLQANWVGGFVKNLFLRNKKGQMWVVVLEQDRHIDLKSLAKRLGISGGLSFASTERMMQYLGVVPGSVTALAVLNDKSVAVSVVIDQSLLAFENIYVHPCRNDQTLKMATADLLELLARYGHPATIVDFDA